jgi:hypothetical protein
MQGAALGCTGDGPTALYGPSTHALKRGGSRVRR